jgi:hypothetical protein
MPANVSIPVSSILSAGTGAQTNTPTGAPSTGTVGTPSTGTGAQTNTTVGSSGRWIGIGKPLFVIKPGGGGLHLYPGLRNTLSNQTITNPDYLYYNEFGKLPPRYGEGTTATQPKPSKPRPTRGRSKSVSGGGGGGGGGFIGVPQPGGTGGAKPPVFTGPAVERVGKLEGLLADDGNGLTGPDGILRPDVQAALIAGLGLDDFDAAIVAYLDPSYTVNFLTWDTGGKIAYIDALLIASLSTYLASNAMNGPTALSYAARGIPVGRTGTGDDGVPTKWLIKERGIWWVGTEGEMAIVTSERGSTPGNVTVADLTARDWVLGIQPDFELPEIDDLILRN